MDYVIKITQQEAALIAQALGEMPMKLVINLFGSIQRQVKEQDDKNTSVAAAGAQEQKE